MPAPRGDGALSRPAADPGRRGRLALLAVAALVIVIVDLFTKELALALLEPGRFVALVGSGVGWQLIFNPGASFGVPLPPIVFPVVTVLLAAVIVRTLDEVSNSGMVLAQGLVLGGAIGNLIDRFTRPGDGSPIGGFVVDFVAWGSFPRFNVADAAITVGVLLFLLLTVLEERAARRSAMEEG